jgi:hypothetical protein
MVNVQIVHHRGTFKTFSGNRARETTAKGHFAPDSCAWDGLALPHRQKAPVSRAFSTLARTRCDPEKIVARRSRARTNLRRERNLASRRHACAILFQGDSCADWMICPKVLAGLKRGIGACGGVA